MKYSLIVKNDYRLSVDVPTHDIYVASIDWKKIEPCKARTIIDIPGMHSIHFLDLGKGHFFPADPDTALLIQYAGRSYQFDTPYKDHNEITVEIDYNGKITLHTGKYCQFTRVNLPWVAIKNVD